MLRKRVVLFFIPFLLFSTWTIQAVEEERNWQDEIVYSIVIDRFNNGDPSNDFEVDTTDLESYHGGDFKGIVDKLDYIKGMGFTTVLLSPIFKIDQYNFHDGDVEDYFEAEEHYGSIEDFKELVAEAHNQEINVIIDFVVSEGVEEDTLLEAGNWWIEETNVDGYRVKGIESLPVSFWEEFSTALHSLKPDFLLIGDTATSTIEQNAAYLDAGFNSTMNYSLHEEIVSSLSSSGNSLEGLYENWSTANEYYRDSFLAGTFIDNDNTVRFTRHSLEKQEHPVTRIKLALSYLYLTPGLPIVTYGTEIVQDGGEPPDNRRLMNFRTDDELEDYLNDISSIRTSLPSIARGDFELVEATDDGMIVYKRSAGDDVSIVAINNSQKTQSITIPTTLLEADKQLRGILEDDMAIADENGYTIILDREKVEVYHLEEEVGINIPLILAVFAVPVLMVVFLVVNKKRVNKRNK